MIVDSRARRGRDEPRAGVHFLVEGPRPPRSMAIGEVRRYILAPTYPMSYLVGRNAILALRERATAKGWTLRECHERLLAAGRIAPALIPRELGWCAALSLANTPIVRTRPWLVRRDEREEGEEGEVAL